MLTKKQVLLVSGLFLILLTGVRFVWNAYMEPPKHPHAVRGVLDLRGVDLAGNRSFPLDGEWAFFEGSLAGEAPEERAAVDAAYIRVPGSWAGALARGGAGAETFGYGSYRLRILVNPGAVQDYGIRIQNVEASSALYVNGTLLGREGRPAAAAADYKPAAKPYNGTFQTDRAEIEVVIEAANFVRTTSGGIVKSVWFGSKAAIEREMTFSSAMQLLLGVVMLVHALYACLLYMIGVRQRTLLYFAALVVSTVFITLTDDSRLLMVWLDINYTWSIKALHLTYMANAVFMLRFALSLLQYGTNRWLRLYFLTAGLAVVYVIVVPISGVQFAAPLFQPITLIAYVAVPTMMLRFALRGGEDGIFLLLSAICIAVNVFWSLVKGISWQSMPYYPFDLMAAMFAFAAFWFKQYIRTAGHKEQLAAKLQEADRMKDEFLANTSHELRNPLHGIINIAQTVLDSGGANRESMELLISVGKRMATLLNDLLDLNRLRKNGLQLYVRPVRIQGVSSGVIDMLRFMTEGKPIELRSAIPDSFPAVMADENRLTQILFNLMHNAVKYTDRGTVTVTAEVREKRAILRVADSGIGMDEATQRSIFLPYERGEEVAAAGSGGLGLGLSISKRLVEHHGGTLTVASERGRGSVFAFDLELAAEAALAAERKQPAAPPFRSGAAARPNVADEPPGSAETVAGSGHAPTAASAGAEVAAAAAAEAGAVESAADGDSPQERPRVLIVDDDPVNLSVLTRVLSTERYDITAVSGGREALSVIGAGGVWDLVIADVMMPGMSGYELTAALRERYSMSELPVLLLTARNRAEDLNAGFRAGANDYVTKPMDAMEIRSRVRALTELKLSIRERMRMEAALLQAQIKPHFLFNTLNAVISLSEIDPPRMLTMLETFNRYLRASFDFRNVDQLVPIEQELDLIRSYLYIEKERFEERLTVRWEVDEDVQMRVPPLTIQPLVENALRHGILSRYTGGEIVIRVSGGGGRAEIAVSDNGVGMEAETLRRILNPGPDRGPGIGIYNTDRRLRQLYGEGLRISSVPGEGTTVAFTVTTLPAAN